MRSPKMPLINKFLTQKEFPDGQLIQKGIHFGLRRKLPTICQIYI